MHGSVKSEVDFDVPLEIVHHRSRPSNSLHKRWAVSDRVGQNIPVPWRGLRSRAVGPEFRQHSREIAALHQIWHVRLTGDRIDRVTGSIIGSQGIISKRPWGNIEHHAVVRSHFAAPPDHLHYFIAKLRIAHAAQTGRRTRIYPGSSR